MTFNPWIELTRVYDGESQLVNLNLIDTITIGEEGAILWPQGSGDDRSIRCLESYDEIFEMIKEKYQ